MATMKESGIPESQAKAFLDASEKAELATRQGLPELNLCIQAKIKAVKLDLAKWIAGMLLVQTGLVVALVKLL